MAYRKLPLGIYEKALPYQVAWCERLQMARLAGFDFLELSIDESLERLARLEWPSRRRHELYHAIRDSGIPVITMCLSAHRKYALGSADPAIRAQALEIFRKAIDFCLDVGIRTIQLAGYYVYYEAHTPGSLARYQDGLAQGLEWATQRGLMLALENVDGHDVDSVSQAMYFVEAFNSPWFQVYPDIGNLGEHGYDIQAELERGAGHLVGIHVKDTRPGEPRRVPFGDGVVDFATAFRTLAAMNYCGPVMLEMWNDDSPEAPQIIANARQWVLRRMQEAGLLILEEV